MRDAMICPSCQQSNPHGAKFCNACGTKLETACPQCGHINPPGSRFCNECGLSLNQPLSPAPAARFASPQSYTPRYLAEKILTSRSVLQGERKQVTVLFADMKGSLELLADRDPEEARALLDAVVQRMMEAVHRYEGTVNHVLGDGIMALFGAPLAHEDHAVRACYAGLAMQAAIRRYAEEVRRTYGIEVQTRVGLNSGEVVVRAIGSDLQMDYSAIGQTTHLASRMEQLATPGTIRLTPETLRLAEGFIQVTSLGPIPVKGLADPVEVFELVGAGPTRRRLEASAARGLTRFVGREAELTAIRQALERAAAGRGQVVGLVGEPGVGKSRLFYEFTRSHRTQEWLVLESSSVSYGKASLFLPVIDLLKTYFEIGVRDAARQIREKLTGKLLTLDPSLGPILPAFLALLDVPVEDAAWQALDPQQRRQRTLDAIKRLLLRESQVQPLLLIFEDLHWIDAETQALLDSLLESLPTTRILLLVNYRLEYQHGWAHKTYYTQLRIDPLPPESAQALLQALLGDDASVQPLKPVLIQRAEGNPFFLEESVRTLVETQVLLGERGSYRLARASPSIQVPATVQAVLAARIDRLPPEEKNLLQGASVIGKDVSFPLLQAIAELPEEELRRGLSHLQAAEFLYETNLFPELEYTFKHALTYEVAYGSLLQERRRGLHAHIVEAIETLYPDRMIEQVERLAHHAFRGEVWPKALLYSRQAGMKAVVRSAHREAVACFERALTALQRLPQSHDTSQQAVDLRFDLRRVLVPLGEYGRIFDYLQTAETLAHTLGDQRRLGRVSIYMADYFWWMGDAHHALDSGKRALDMAAALGDLSLQAAAHFSLGQAYYALGDYPQAIDFHRRSVASAEGERTREHVSERILRAVTSRAWLAWSLAEVGEFPEGIARGEEGVRMAEAVDQPYSLIAAYLGMGILYLRKGDLHKAIPMLERCLSLCQVGHLPVYFPWVSMCLGAAYALAERVTEALPLLRQAVEQAASMNIMGRHLFWAASLCEAHLLAEQTDTAIALARLALDLSHTQKARGHQAWVLRLLSEIALRSDPVDHAQAETSYGQALALADELGMRPLLAHCHRGLGTLYRQMGRQEQARVELSTAIDLYRAMEMTLWLPQTEAALAETA